MVVILGLLFDRVGFGLVWFGLVFVLFVVVIMGVLFDRVGFGLVWFGLVWVVCLWL